MYVLYVHTKCTEGKAFRTFLYFCPKFDKKGILKILKI